ncbi:unnamed protein product, partial [Timema podura]|nr:unnamed protein product [Timema podura]
SSRCLRQLAGSPSDSACGTSNFQKADPFFVFFLALVMIVNAREQILSMKNDSKQTIVDTLSAMPCALEADDVTDFCSLAQYYDLKTPSSFK